VIVLGIDPGSRKTGWAVIQVEGRAISAVDYGILRLDVSGEFVDRLVELHNGLAALLDRHPPDHAAVEAIFQSGTTKNYQSALKLGQARGVALLAIASRGIPIEEYPPAEVKKSLAGHGRAEKWQVQEMIRIQLSLAATPPEDAADALAIATCHALRLQNPIWRALR